MSPGVSQALTPYLAVRDAAAALTFYAEVFGAIEVSRWTDDSGRIGHAELRFGMTRLFLADEHPELGVLGPLTRGGESTSFVLEVDDVDTLWDAALAAGCTVDRPVAESGHGRGGWLHDPFGHRWNLYTPVLS